MLEQLEMDLFDDENFEFYPEVEYNENDVYMNEGPLRMSLFGRRSAISKHYDDFQTIDWQKERSHSHNRKVYYSNLKYGPFLAKLQWLYEKSSVLLVLALVGITCSITSFLVSMGVHFFSDIRDGVCYTGFLFNKHECCWDSTFSDEGCSNWVTWSQLLLHTESSSTFIIDYIFYFAISILLSFASAVVVYYVAPYASGGGITELKMILSGFIMRGFLGFITYIVKTATLILSASSGLLLGQEGPMVHIACCIANLYIRLFPKFWENEADKREILTASTAVGMATAFNSPLTGVLFTLEETSFYFTAGVLWKSFYGAMIGVFILASFLPYSNGNIVLYSVSSADWHEFEIPLFALIGILGGLYGVLFTKMLFYWDLIKQKFKFNKYPIAEVVLVTAFTVLISFPLEFSKLSNHHLIARMFKSCNYYTSDKNNYCQEVPDMFTAIYPYGENASAFITHEIKGVTFALFIKMILLVFTFGLKVPCGIFVPSIVIGSMLGRIFGLSLEYLSITYPKHYIFMSFCTAKTRCIYPSLYAVVGSAAVLGGITQMTVCVVVMMIEITGKLSYILPLILAVTLAKWVSNALLKHGLYEQISITNHIPYLSNKDEISLPHTLMKGYSITNKSELVKLPELGMDLATLGKLLETKKYSCYPVVQADSLLFGSVTFTDLNQVVKDHLLKIPVSMHSEYFINFTASKFTSTNEYSSSNVIYLRKIVDRNPMTLHPKAPLNAAIYIFQKLGLSRIFIVEKGIPLGIVTRKDIILQIHKLTSE